MGVGGRRRGLEVMWRFGLGFGLGCGGKERSRCRLAGGRVLSVRRGSWNCFVWDVSESADGESVAEN